jgi:PAS domain-containing protein
MTLDDRARRTLDGIDVPLSVALAIRDSSHRLLDFRLLFVNLAAARWASVDQDALVGRLATEVVPALRVDGLFEALERVVSTGEPLRRTGRYEGVIDGGPAFSAVFDLMAIRIGDGYLGAWSPIAEAGTGPSLEAVVAEARSVVATP